MDLNDSPKIIKESHQKLINRYMNRLERISNVFDILKEKYGLEQSYLKTILNPKSKLFNLKPEEIVDRFEFYTELFGSKDNFYNMIKKDSIYHCQFYAVDGGIFNWKNKQDSADKLEFIKSFYGLSHSQALEFIMDNIYYYNSDIDLLDHILYIAEFFSSVDKES